MKVHIKRKERTYEFENKGKNDVMNIWSKKTVFSSISWYKDDLSIAFTKLR